MSTADDLRAALDAIWNMPYRQPVVGPIPEDQRGDLIHWCCCRELALNFRLTNGLCQICGMTFQYVGTKAEVREGLRKLLQRSPEGRRING